MTKQLQWMVLGMMLAFAATGHEWATMFSLGLLAVLVLAQRIWPEDDSP